MTVEVDSESTDRLGRVLAPSRSRKPDESYVLALRFARDPQRHEGCRNESYGCRSQVPSGELPRRMKALRRWCRSVACSGYSGFATISQNTNITAVNAGTPSQNHSRA